MWKGGKRRGGRKGRRGRGGHGRELRVFEREKLMQAAVRKKNPKGAYTKEYGIASILSSIPT
jgi:hypothetical protein